MLTLTIGTGLGSIFGINGGRGLSPASNFAPQRDFGCSAYKRRYQNSSTPLVILSEPNTQYTAAATRNQTVGVVRLRVEFGADGQARVLERLMTLPDGLTEEAERVAEQTRFTPETVRGEPISVTRERTYVFSLSNRGPKFMKLQYDLDLGAASAAQH